MFDGSTAGGDRPINLAPVDEITITILVDNSFDSLLASTGPAHRPILGEFASIPADHFEEGHTTPGLRAEHGFSALVAVRTGERLRTLLLDTGITPDGILTNADLARIDLTTIEAVVLSHGHSDHTGGLAALARRLDHPGLPVVLHPHAWRRRRSAIPGREPRLLPTLSKTAVQSLALSVVERREPSLLLDGQVLVTGEIERTTDYERGMPNHESFQNGAWEPDPSLLDDQAIVVQLRGRGLVILTGCGHAGAINLVRYAQHLTGTDRVCALLGGLHLSGAAFERVIDPTVAALADLAPDLIVPAHCTGWKAQHRLASVLPDAFIPNSVGTSYRLTAGLGSATR